MAMFSGLKNKISQYLYRKYNYSFSQCGEDGILAHMLRMPKGTFVDIGAYHPYHSSNTYLFYRKGWRGINIDASPGSMEEFKKLRPEDINLEVAISNEDKELDYYFLDEGHQMNTFSKETLDRIGYSKEIKKVIKIKTQRLADILEKYMPNKEINFFSIDVEGLELSVLQSNNWDKFRPMIILLESFDVIDDKNTYDVEIREYLGNKGYKLFAKIPLGVFFVRNDLKIGSTNYIDV
jgi:FkbM family methyltransferase